MSAIITRSPPLLVHSRNDIDEDAQGDPGQAKLTYFVAIFNGSRRSYPKANVVVTGSPLAVNRVSSALTGRHQIPPNKIVADYDEASPGGGNVELVIVYNAYSSPKKVVVSFEDKLLKVVNVEFEVSPDGAYVEEVAGQLSVKQLIQQRAAQNALRDITFKTKLSGVVSYDRETLAKVETALKGKIQTSILAEVHLQGLKGTPLTVELFGWFGTKIYSDKLKPILGGGIGVSW